MIHKSYSKRGGQDPQESLVSFQELHSEDTWNRAHPRLSQEGQTLTLAGTQKAEDRKEKGSKEEIEKADPMWTEIQPVGKTGKQFSPLDASCVRDPATRILDSFWSCLISACPSRCYIA